MGFNRVSSASDSIFDNILSGPSVNLPLVNENDDLTWLGEISAL